VVSVRRVFNDQPRLRSREEKNPKSSPKLTTKFTKSTKGRREWRVGVLLRLSRMNWRVAVCSAFVFFEPSW
jgi:hypothetical protein